MTKEEVRNSLSRLGFLCVRETAKDARWSKMLHSNARHVYSIHFLPHESRWEVYDSRDVGPYGTHNPFASGPAISGADALAQAKSVIGAENLFDGDSR